MSETQVQVIGDGRAPAQTATGEIVDQAKPLVQETTSSTETKTETTSATSSQEDKSLLNKDVKAAASPGAPEKYTDFTVPEGYTLDETVLKESSELFKSLNLDQAGAQKLIDMYVAKTSEAFQQPYKAYKDMREGWVKEIKADPEIGAKLDQVKSTVARAIDGLGDAKLADSFREAMDVTGAGDHPAFIRVFYRLAQLVTEGKPVAGSGPSAHGQRQPGAAPVSAARALYPNNP